jgi:hypothetical protein
LVEIRDDHAGLQPKRWKRLEDSYSFKIPNHVWKALAEGDEVAGESIGQAAGSWRKQAKLQRDSRQALVPPASSQ